MSREIKFRYVFKRKTDGHIYIIEFSIEALEDKSVSQIKTMLRNDFWKLVARDQFTGLLDKNGKEIYESDIVRICNNKNGYFEVIFVNAYVGGWVLRHKDYEEVSLGARKIEDVEIIGNIHENKDLLP